MGSVRALSTRVETLRLVLRRWRPDDEEHLAAVFADPAVWHFPYGRGWTAEEVPRFLAAQEASWAEHGFGLWAVEVKDSGVLIGAAGLSIPTFLPEVLPAIELGWRLHHDYWGRGLATEAGHAALEHGFTALGVERIISIAQPGNAASKRLAEKLGMLHERETVHPDRGVALVVCVLTRSQWRSARQAL